jgi:hypothetical protein
MATRKGTGGTSSTPPAAAAPGVTKAQAEFQRYKSRLAAEQATAGAGGNPLYAVPVGFGGGMPAWGIPPSLTMLPHPPGVSGFGPAMIAPSAMAAGSLADRIGSSLRLGLDVVNAVLAGSARILDGMYGRYEYDEMRCGYGSCCSCCESCCNECCSCCSPSVGRCC